MVRKLRLKGASSLTTWIINVVLLGGSFLMLAPFIWCFSTSLGNPLESFSLPPKLLPTDLAIKSYRAVFSQVPFLTFMWNSFKIASLITIGQLLTCSMAAFAFARLRFPGRDMFFMILLSSLMVPPQVTIIPIFILIRYLNMMDKHSSLIVPVLISAFGVFLLRQFFLSIPKDLEDAAKIDGAGYFTIFSKIFLPLAGPALSTLGIICFNHFWNEFFRPLIFLWSKEKMTVPLGLILLRGYLDIGNPSVVMAGVTMAILPVLAALILAQRYLVAGITLTGLKG